MNFALLWIDALILSLLWVAAWSAYVGRIKRNWLRRALVVIVAGSPLFLLGTFVFATAAARFVGHVEPSWFGYSLSLFLSYLIGASLILRRGYRRTPGMLLAVEYWPRGILTFAWMITLVIGYMTLLNMDLVIRARCALESVQLNSIYLATLPAIVSESQNAAPLYEQAFARLKDAQDDEATVNNPPTGNRDDFDPAEPATISFLSHQASTIDLLRRAAALPACRFDQDLLDTDIDAMMSGLNEERNAANVLNLHAREEVARGHVASAMTDADSILRMGRHFGHRPLIITALVGIGIDALGDRTLEIALPAVKTHEELSLLHEDSLASPGPLFQSALRGEERYGLTLYGNMPATQQQMVKGNLVDVQDHRILSAEAGISGAFLRVFYLDSDDYARVMSMFQDMSKEPYYTVKDQWNAACGPGSRHGLLTSIALPAISNILETFAKIEADHACARTAVAMTKFRLDHGTLPTNLTDLVPGYLEAVPTDPYDGHPLRLTVRKDQSIIYSVGPDGVDDGGVEMNRQRKGDVIFTLKSAPVATTGMTTTAP